VPGRYAFLFSVADAAGNVGTARLRVAVVTRSTFSFVRVAASNASSLQEAEAEAEALVDAASATNVAYRGELAALLTSVAAVTAEAVWLEDVTVVWANATAEADGEWVVRMAVSVSAALAGDEGSNASGGRGRRMQAVDDAVAASVGAMMAALEAGGATGVSSDGETRVDAARLAVVELQATLAQLSSSYTAITLRLSTLVGAPNPPASFECGSSVHPPAPLSLTVGECPSRTQNSDAGWPGTGFQTETLAVKPDSRQWKQAHLTLLLASLEAETQQIELFMSSVQLARERAEALSDRASALVDTTTQATAVLLTVTRSAAQLLAEEALADADDGGDLLASIVSAAPRCLTDPTNPARKYYFSVELLQPPPNASPTAASPTASPTTVSPTTASPSHASSAEPYHAPNATPVEAVVTPTVSFYGLTVETSPTTASPASPAVSPTAASSYQAPTAMPTVSFYGLTVETSPTTELDPYKAIISNANRRHLLRWVIMHLTPRRRL
jgi:hypothetical protein